MDVNKNDTIRKVLALGSRGTQFQSRQIREALGVQPSDRAATACIYNHLKSLEQESIIEEVSGERKRNRYFRIKDENKLRVILGGNSRFAVSNNIQLPAAPERLIRIEGAVNELQHRLETLEAKVDHLIAVWS